VENLDLMMHYLDYAATSPLAPGVAEAMKPFGEATGVFANPNSLHEAGQTAKAAIENARNIIAQTLHCTPAELIFTSGGTESDNLAILGIMRALKEEFPQRQRCIITSAGEHSAVLEPARYLQRYEGVTLIELPLTPQGVISTEALQQALATHQEAACLVSLMHVNNETGAMHDIATLAHITQHAGQLFHTDAVQSLGKVPLDLSQHLAGVNYLSATAHKCGGPRGAGILFIREGRLCPHPIIHGGQQEQGLRGGTHNTPAIVGFGAALHYAQATQHSHTIQLQHLHQQVLEGIAPWVEAGVAFLNTPTQLGTYLPGIINLSLPIKTGDALVLYMDMHDIAVSSGSACHAERIDPSHVILAQTQDAHRASHTLRISLGPETTETAVKVFLNVLNTLLNNSLSDAKATPKASS
jgi:cysteine desulfurase